MAAVRSSETSAILHQTTWRRFRKTTLLIFTAIKTSNLTSVSGPRSHVRI
jgi:hypothetical protein